MLVTVVSYRRITGDDATAASAVSARIEEAIAALEDVLERPLEEDERTERLYPTRDGRLWPKAVPIVDPGDYQADGNALRSTAPFPWSGFGTSIDYLDVTYTGGLVERSANPDATNRLPEYMERDIAWAAHRLEHAPAPGQYPAGATSVSLGDASISFGQGGAPAGVDVLDGMWSRRTLAWRHRVVGGVP